MSGDLADAEWIAFITKLETAEEEFVRVGLRHCKLCGRMPMMLPFAAVLGGVECGWQNVTDRVSWVSQKYSDGTRSREEITRMVGADFAYLVQREIMHSRLASQAEPSTQELRATMVFRREADGWRIVHRHADLQIATKPPQ
jgi:SnoaL-like protein